MTGPIHDRSDAQLDRPSPGADPATVAWHATLHPGLAAIVLGAGAIFLLLAVRAYRQREIRSPDVFADATATELATRSRASRAA